MRSARSPPARSATRASRTRSRSRATRPLPTASPPAKAGWLVVEGGIQGNPHTVLTTTTGAIEVGHAIVASVSQTSIAFADATYNQGTDINNLNTYNFGRRGGWSEVAGDRLFGFGANAINELILFRSGDVCNGSPCTSAASFTGNLQLEATSYTVRFLPGATLYGG